MAMAVRTMNEQLVKYLTDVHSVEEQALAQLRLAPRIAADPELAAIYREHLRETEGQERLVRDRLSERGGAPSRVKDIAGRAGGWGMVLFARFNPDTPGKLQAHSFSYEHMELAAYELLRRAAERAGDERTAELARTIGDQERAMSERLEATWDRAVDASLREKGAEDIQKELVKYLRDAHALEAQAMQLLESGAGVAGLEQLEGVFREHLEQTREHQRLIDERLRAHDAGPARFQAGALRLGALNFGMFFRAQPDTPAKLAGFAYAFEALEIAAYELLERVARRAGDDSTAQVAQRILVEERAAADKVAGTWDAAMQAAMEAQGVTA
jgi:ferritin-like metal-binding protein YciE